ncbi:hypothetical protein [Sorangium sp. So ce131]|uniref:hypothetical protein n=1 Tax=Sorangium sp. So ce131 TaxID=3133282 RepID=UPI003F5E75D4
MRRILMLALVPVIAGGCAGVDGWEGAGEEAESSERAAVTAAPRLLQYRQISDGVSETRYLAELPQDSGEKVLLRLAGCREEGVVREMFGLRQSAIAEWTGAVDEAWPEIACPDRIATDAGVYAEPRTLGTSLLEYRITGETPAAGPGRYFVIQNRCAGLMTHLDIPGRARRAPAVPLGTPTWTPPAGATPIRLSCANERPQTTYEGWEVHTAFVPSLEFRTMLIVKKGNTSFFVESLDGQPYNDVVDDAERARKLDGLRALLGVPSTSASLDDVVEDELIEEGHPFFDVCLDRCADPDWVPSHKVVREGYLECESGALDPETGGCVEGARREVTDRLELDGTTSRRAPLGDVVLDLEVCSASETWERRLGLARRADAGETWMQRLTAAYNAGKSAAEAAPPASVALPCIAPTRTCTATLRDLSDLSSTTLASLTRSCRAGDEALEIRLGKRATLTRQAFTIDAAALPAGMRAVRLVGDAERTTVTVSPPVCGFGTTTACTDPQPAIVVQGDLTLDVEHLRLVSRAATTGAAGAPPAPLARIAVQATGSSARGLVLRARDVHVVGDDTPAFYKGIVFSGGSLALYNSSVRAYTDAVSVDRGRVATVSWPVAGAYAIESLAQPGIPSASLVDLRGRWLGGSAANFRALALNADVQAFVVGMRVAGPTAVSWSDDRAVWPEDGLLAVDGDFTSAAGYFARESVMLSVSGRGQLSFVAPRVTDFAHVLRCPTTLSGGTARITFDRPEFQDITYALRQGACTFESASQWEPTGE